MQDGVTIDRVFLDNRNNDYHSAAFALNIGAQKAKGEVFVFLHQDIEFLDPTVLKKIYNFSMANPNTVFGAAGVMSRNKRDYKNILLSSMYSGLYRTKNYGLNDDPKECFTLDECLIACHRSVFEKIRFDEKTCDGWHLYGADLCLQAQTIEGLNVMAVPMDIWHKSNGNADKAYFKTQNRVAIKYRKFFKVINTTNGYQYTNTIKRIILNIYRIIRY